MTMTLRLNQGDASEARIYYLPHLVAAGRREFAAAGLDIVLVGTDSGGATIRGGQIPMLMAGEAELAVGGPMVTMRMKAEGSGHLVCLAATVAASPWVLASASGAAAFDWSVAAPRRILDIGRIGTATLCLDWLRGRHGLAEQVRVEPGSGDIDADLARLAAEPDLLAFHSLHHLAPALADGRVVVASRLADAIGPVPWSAYIARPEVIAAHRDAFAAFRAAIGRALAWIATADPDAIGDVVAVHFPDVPRRVLVRAIAEMQAVGIWPTTPDIPRADYERFHGIMLEQAWLPAPVPFAAQIDATLG